MALYDISYQKDRLVDPNNTENMEIIRVLKKKVNSISFDRVVKTIAEALEFSIKNSTKLVWVSAGSLFGYSSLRPHKDVDHLWTKIMAAVGDGKECLWGVGALLKWQVALREETWVLYKQERDEIDPETGKPIYVSEYWIDKTGKFDNK